MVRLRDKKDSLEMRQKAYGEICKKMLAIGRAHGFYYTRQREDAVEYTGDVGIGATDKAWAIAIDAEKIHRLRTWGEYGKVVIYKPE